MFSSVSMTATDLTMPKTAGGSKEDQMWPRATLHVYLTPEHVLIASSNNLKHVGTVNS